MDNTRKTCQSSHPDNKKMMWEAYFSNDKNGLCANWNLHDFNHSMSGWNQVQHRHLTEPFEDEFFKNILQIFKTKASSIYGTYYRCLSPQNKSDAASINKYRTLLASVEKDEPDQLTLIRKLKDTIENLETQEKGRQCSKDWLAKQN